MRTTGKFWVFIFGLCLGAADSFSQDEFDSGDKRRVFREIAEDLRCPTCTGLSVLGSDAPFSKQIKGLVKNQIREGKSKSEIMEYFNERYGPWILRAPPKTGINLVAWSLPVILLLLGPVLVWLFVWRKRRYVASLSVRSTEVLVEEFNQRLSELRSTGVRS